LLWWTTSVYHFSSPYYPWFLSLSLGYDDANITHQLGAAKIARKLHRLIN